MEFLEADRVYAEREIEKIEDEMNVKLLKGVTHMTVVMTKTKEIAEKTGVYGVLFLHFGPDESNAIGQIHLVKNEGRMVWRPPQVSVAVGGQSKTYPVFKGKIAEEISEWSQTAQDLLRKTFRRPEFGHKYRIANGKAFDETPTEVTADA